MSYRNKIYCLVYILIDIITNVSLSKTPKTSSSSLGRDEEFFTAASDMLLLLKVEQKMGNGLVNYIKREAERLDALEKKIKEIDKEHDASIDDESYVSHITNAHGILKRFGNFWSVFDKHVKPDGNKADRIRKSLQDDLKSLEGTFPSEYDLRGALTAITRIQDTYNITATEFIYDMGFTQKLDAQELFQMGYLWSELQDYKHAREWFLEAIKRFPKNKTWVGFLDKASLYEYLAWSEYQTFDIKSAIKHTKYVLKLKPTHRTAITNLKVFTEYAKKLKKDGMKAEDLIKEGSKKNKRKVSWENGKHNELCRGISKMEQSRIDKLYCTYGKYKPQFILKPLKIEYAYDDPNITLFHGLLNDFQINHVKERSSPYLSRATVHDVTTGKLSHADYRISKSSWIKPEMDKVVAGIFKKIHLVTDLDTRSYEPLQIANYGLAGQYEPHYDHAIANMPKRFSNYGGNRLATMLMYMSDVERGGSTVFTKTGPGVSIYPEKGMGAFWYNLKRNGKSNNKTEHAACPVVLGQKWVSNIWIHEHYQEFSRGCTLNKDE